MKITFLIPVYLVGKIGCHLAGHRFVTTRSVTKYFKEYRCKNCGLELTNDENGKKVSLTPSHREINETLSQFYQKRQNAG